MTKNGQLFLLFHLVVFSSKFLWKVGNDKNFMYEVLAMMMGIEWLGNYKRFNSQ